jgi:mRNA interferase RelE/StbE
VTYRIELTRRAEKQFKDLPSTVQQRIKPKVDALSENPLPDGVSKLQGADDLYRIRVGDYRVIYQIQNKQLLVLVVKVAPRRDAYR